MRSAHRGTAITLSWTRPADVVRSVVVRVPGLKGKKPSVVYDGKANTLVDRKITPGARYWYEVRLYDQAGNLAAMTVGLKPGAGIFSPIEGEVVKRPPVVELGEGAEGALLQRPAVAREREVAHDVAAVTEAGAPPRPGRSAGKKQRLRPGRYRLFVWPAFGTPKTPALRQARRPGLLRRQALRA